MELGSAHTEDQPIGDFEGRMNILVCGFHAHISDLENRADVLQWCIYLNTLGTKHTDDEIEKVKTLIKQEKMKTLL